MISLRVCTLLYRDINICIAFFYAEHGIDMGSFYLLEVKDLKDIFPHAENQDSSTPSERMCYKIHANIPALFNFLLFLNVPIQSQYFILGKFYIQH